MWKMRPAWRQPSRRWRQRNSPIEPKGFTLIDFLMKIEARSLICVRNPACSLRRDSYGPRYSSTGEKPSRCDFGS